MALGTKVYIHYLKTTELKNLKNSSGHGSLFSYTISLYSSVSVILLWMTSIFLIY